MGGIVTPMPSFIHASLLTKWPDCPRRGVARGFRKLVENAGHKLAEPRRNIAAMIGTTVHAGIEETLKRGIDASRGTAYAVAEETLSAAIRDGVEWDDKCATRQQAERQAFQLLTQARMEVLPRVNVPSPEHVERTLNATLCDGWLMTGTADAITSAGIVDFKTTQLPVPPWSEPQLGLYSLMAKANRAIDTVTKLTQVTFRRVSGNTKLKDPVITRYSVLQAEQIAYTTAQNVVTAVDAFRTTGNPSVFPVNPNSMLCSARWCVAHGTTFCPHGRGLEEGS